MNIINGIAFNIIWFTCVYWGNIASYGAIVLICIHFTLIENKLNEFKLLTVILLLGIFLESFLISMNIFIFPNERIIPPLWLIVIWASFACTLNYSLRVLHKYKLLQWFIGAFIVPVSYVSAYHLGAVSFYYSIFQTYIILSFVWLFIFKLSLKLAYISLSKGARYG